jgi:GDP-mannose 6-dehydrogenase
MKVSIFGLGYVGVVSAACLASKGYEIIGVDINETKVNMMKDGHSPLLKKTCLNSWLKAGKRE